MGIAVGRLINWGRWARVWAKVEPDGQAMSYEGNFRVKGDEDEKAVRKGPAPDLADAWDIETACRMLPVKHHAILKLRYVMRESDGGIMYAFRTDALRMGWRIRMSGSDLDAAEGMALVLLEDALSMPAVVRMDRARAAVRRILRTATAEVIS